MDKPLRIVFEQYKENKWKLYTYYYDGEISFVRALNFMENNNNYRIISNS